MKSGMTTAMHDVQTLACNIARFEQLVAEHGGRLQGIEMLLDEIETEEVRTADSDDCNHSR